MEVHTGLSPRMRGNLLSLSDVPLDSGSIPAHAGEPLYPIAYLTERQVYPRACGGTRLNQAGVAAG